MIQYKGYTAVIEYLPKEKSLHGRIVDVRDVISFDASSADELEDKMREAVDDYIAFCEEQGIEAAKPFSGRFNVRMTPDMHRAVSTAAEHEGRSMNEWVVDKLSDAVAIAMRARRAIDEVAVTERSRGKASKSKKAG
jgi:predicted HicB family RNase H-like nuclease